MIENAIIISPKAIILDGDIKQNEKNTKPLFQELKSSSIILAFTLLLMKVILLLLMINL